jgi:toxin-antitoxin system PIN domain toxin
VILVDANLLVYAHLSSFEQHEASRAWLDARLGGSARVALPWESLLAFARIASNPRVLSKPLTVAAAWGQVEEWLGAPAAWVPAPTERHAEVLGRLLRASGLRAQHVPDAHLAALAIEHGLVLCSTDGDFARFAGLRWENPLAG